MGARDKGNEDFKEGMRTLVGVGEIKRNRLIDRKENGMTTAKR